MYNIQIICCLYTLFLHNIIYIVSQLHLYQLYLIENFLCTIDYSRQETTESNASVTSSISSTSSNQGNQEMHINMINTNRSIIMVAFTIL